MTDQLPNNASGSSTFRLNPTATEFVPKFTSPSAKPQQYQQQHQQPYHNNHNNHYNQNHNNHHNQNRNNNYRNQNNNYMGNQNDIDPIEMEARCEAVVEILQDERVREHLNPLMNGSAGPQASQGGNNQQDPSPSSAPAANAHHQQQDFNECDDEEEMFEMMAMQEECRMEMMKFYIQSQNPELFSEIYHDVSYPDQPMKLNPTGVPPPAVVNATSGESSTSPTVSNSSADSPTKSTDAAQKLEQLNLNNESDSKKQ